MTSHSEPGSQACGKLGLLPAYDGDHLDQIAFPLGGLGTGCVSISGRGDLVDWEIFNRPNKGSQLPYSFFTLWCQADGDRPLTRIVQGPPSPPFSGVASGRHRGIGFGVTRENGSGFPHMRSARFRGEFPLAEIEFTDPSLPVAVTLEAYSPFIPLNPDDSGLPIAVFHFRICNRSSRTVALTLAGNLFNAIGYPGGGPFVGGHLGRNVNAFVDDGAVRGLICTSDKFAPEDPAFGSVALTTSWPRVTHQSCWLRGRWFDMLHDFWDHFSESGALEPRDYGPSEEGQSDVGTLGLQASLSPGETVLLPLYLTWYFPNFVRYWKQTTVNNDREMPPSVWRNYYASQWRDALDVAHYYSTHAGRLYAETCRFHDALFASKLPPYVLDALSSQASILHSPTVVRLEDGAFYGFEGCHGDSGCCEGSCTHVWNYAQTTAFLFPSLERSMRDADYTYNMRDDGRMCFRLQLPLGSPLPDFHAAADGQMGGVLKVYRDWLLYGDDDWLRALWPKVKLALSYAWVQWDADRDGMMEGVQHNTYDIEFYGPNTMMGSFYLGALRAAEEMAQHLGDVDAAREYRCLFIKGRANMERELFNGEYYVQKCDAPLAKYQYGEGCLSDQLIGQWFAHLVGLGYLFEPEHVRSALKAIFRHNFRTEFWAHANPQRIYALNEEQGLLLCSWPRGGRPAFPFVYSDEVWCGIEYQVASHLIYEGLVDEGLAIVKGLRARHDGVRRNPWNEFECGSHYARSLASWSLLTALSGFRFGLPHGMVGFAPRLHPEDFSCFWSTGSAWGTYAQSQVAGAWRISLHVDYGELTLNRLRLGGLQGAGIVRAQVAGADHAVSVQADTAELLLVFAEALELRAGQTLVLDAS